MPETPSPRWQLTGVLLNRDARRLGPHVWRLACLVALWSAFALASSNMLRTAAPGLVILKSLTFVSAVGLVAWAIFGIGSLFRDEWIGNNLDLVQLTGVSAFDLLVAKLIPMWLTAASLLLLEIPCLQLCVTLGGVTPIQVWAVVWQLSWLFLVVSVMTVSLSTRFRSPGVIAVLSVMFAVLYCVVTFVLIDLPFKVFAISVLNQPTGMENSVSAASFPMQFALIFGSRFTGPIINWQSGIHFLLVAGILRLSAWILRHKLSVSRDVPPLEEMSPAGQAHRANLKVWRPSYVVPAITGNAIAWKDYHFTLGGREMQNRKWLLLAISLPVLALVAVMLVMEWAYDWNPLLALMLVIAVLTPVGSLAFMAQRLWLQEIREQTLEGLVLLPYTGHEILLAKLSVLIKMSLPELVLYLAVLGFLGFCGWREQDWTLFGSVAWLVVSLPMVVCTDAAWRFLPPSWAGFPPRTQLGSMNLSVWIISGCVAYFVSLFAGLLLLALLVTLASRSAIEIGAYWLENHAGELE